LFSSRCLAHAYILQIKGQRREVLSAAEQTHATEQQDQVQRALEKAAAAPPLPVVNKPVRGRSGAGAAAAAMDVDDDAAAASAPGEEEPLTGGLTRGEARLRKVLGVHYKMSTSQKNRLKKTLASQPRRREGQKGSRQGGAA
jgi:hypothetical protein